MCVQYWSKEGLKQHGDLFVELTQETNFTHYTMRELSLTNTKVELHSFTETVSLNDTSYVDQSKELECFGLQTFVSLTEMHVTVYIGSSFITISPISSPYSFDPGERE